MTRIAAGALAALMAAASLAAGAQPAHESRAVNRGREVALDICSICHVVAPNQQEEPMLREPTPSFEEIANRPDATYKSLRRFVATTHWDRHTTPMTMDNFVLPGHDMDDVILYILSLRKPPAEAAKARP